MISFYLEFDKNPYLSLIIFGVPAVISVVISSLVIRHNLLNNQSREQGLLRLALAHTPSILGLVAAFIYLFI
jgi:F0F1-type ATP synthase membrane subunit c/vacuolar-type H+-ATPase subunit K